MDKQNTETTKFSTKFKKVFKISTLNLFVWTFFVGVFAGLGAVLFRLLINFIMNVTFFGKVAFFLGGNEYILPSIWGAAVIFVPVIGALLVTWLTKNFAPEAKGHGVPEVLYAIHYKEGVIRPIVALVKAIASAISIGTGGSVGREGPIVQIGAAFGATVGQIIKMTTDQRVILIAAGAGAGIAATFNTPLAGVIFAIELILVSINALSIGLVTIAVVVATTVSFLFLGNETTFTYTAVMQNQNLEELSLTLLLFIPFGVLIGCFSAIFIYTIYWFEDFFDARIKNQYLRHASGMFVVGIIFYLFMLFYGQYYTAGVGYATIQELLNHLITNPSLLVLLFFGKLLATGLTLGSGGSGGVFSPSLFLGAILGALYCIGTTHFFPDLNIEPIIFVLAGMAGVVGGTTGAFITAIVMVFEMTNYNNVLPIMLTVAFAYLIRNYFSPESIYTLKIFRRGFALPQGLHANTARLKRNED